MAGLWDEMNEELSSLLGLMWLEGHGLKRGDVVGASASELRADVGLPCQTFKVEAFFEMSDAALTRVREAFDPRGTSTPRETDTPKQKRDQFACMMYREVEQIAAGGRNGTSIDLGRQPPDGIYQTNEQQNCAWFFVRCVAETMDAYLHGVSLLKGNESYREKFAIWIKHCLSTVPDFPVWMLMLIEMRTGLRFRLIRRVSELKVHVDDKLGDLLKGWRVSSTILQQSVTTYEKRTALLRSLWRSTREDEYSTPLFGSDVDKDAVYLFERVEGDWRVCVRTDKMEDEVYVHPRGLQVCVQAFVGVVTNMSSLDWPMVEQYWTRVLKLRQEIRKDWVPLITRAMGKELEWKKDVVWPVLEPDEMVSVLYYACTRKKGDIETCDGVEFIDKRLGRVQTELGPTATFVTKKNNLVQVCIHGHEVRLRLKEDHAAKTFWKRIDLMALIKQKLQLFVVGKK